ncbi:hypothetical protein BsWGS_02383 [Bradybaena similaris]
MRINQNLLHRCTAIFQAIVLFLTLPDAHGIIADNLLNLLNGFHLGITNPLANSDAALAIPSFRENETATAGHYTPSFTLPRLVTTHLLHSLYHSWSLHTFIHSTTAGHYTPSFTLPRLVTTHLHSLYHGWSLHTFIHSTTAGHYTPSFTLPRLVTTHLHSLYHGWSLHTFIHSTTAGHYTPSFTLPRLVTTHLHSLYHGWSLHTFIHSTTDCDCQLLVLCMGGGGGE